VSSYILKGFTGKMIGEAANVTLMTEEIKLGSASAVATTVSNSALIAQAKEGDRAAFDQLIITYQNKVFATAWRLLGNREDARDAGQEVFLRVFKHINKFDNTKDFSAWLYRIVVRGAGGTDTGLLKRRNSLGV
jgi:hypothetical protein